MKTYFFSIAIIFVFVTVITAMVRPDIVEAKYLELRAPIDQRNAEQNAEIWKKAKETEKAAWMMKLNLGKDCTPPSTSLKELECNQAIEQHRLVFARNWNSKVRDGWKPEGVTE